MMHVVKVVSSLIGGDLPTVWAGAADRFGMDPLPAVYRALRLCE